MRFEGREEINFSYVFIAIALESPRRSNRSPLGRLGWLTPAKKLAERVCPGAVAGGLAGYEVIGGKPAWRSGIAGLYPVRK